MGECERLQIVFCLGSISDFEVLQELLAVAQKLDCLTDVEFESTRLSASEFLTQVQKSGKWSHEIKIGRLVALKFGVVTAWEHCFISITQLNSGGQVDWDSWLAPFIKKQGFVQAWLVRCDFDYWQNAEQPVQYELAGRDYSGLPLKSNGLPPPLGDMWIDISNNPGRRVLKEGYVEAVGEKMWLSTIFKKRIGGIDVERLRVAGWTVNTEGAEGYVVLTTPSGSFRDNERLERQRKLRSALYE